MPYWLDSPLEFSLWKVRVRLWKFHFWIYCNIQFLIWKNITCLPNPFYVSSIRSMVYLEQHCLQSEKWFEKFCFEWMHTHRLFFIECNFWSSFVICDTDHEYSRCSLYTSLQRITDGSVLPRRLRLQPQWREPGQVVKKKIGKLESNQNTICQLYWICSSQEVTVDIVALTTNKNQGIINY